MTTATGPTAAGTPPAHRTSPGGRSCPVASQDEGFAQMEQGLRHSGAYEQPPEPAVASTASAFSPRHVRSWHRLHALDLPPLATEQHTSSVSQPGRVITLGLRDIDHDSEWCYLVSACN